MKIVASPDSFKGSLSARELCKAIQIGVRRVCSDAEVVNMPLADGGEGTVENMVYSTGGVLSTVTVSDPLGRPVYATYGVMGDGETVVIEMAQASGLPLLFIDERDPLIASSYGTGELILHALVRGGRRFIIGLGGSATNDGGAGMLNALGVKFLNEEGHELASGGAALLNLMAIDDTDIDPRLQECTFIVASDVTNRLCGEEGASAIFGPQKGATPEMVHLLDEALNHFAEVVTEHRGIDMRKVAGSGAAGGMGGALIAFLDARIRPGIEVVMEAVQFRETIRGADLIITGEGRLDAQTLSGKVISGVSRIARSESVPVIAVCGDKKLNASQMDELGIVSAFPIVSGPCSLEESLERTGDLVADAVEQLVRLLGIDVNWKNK